MKLPVPAQSYAQVHEARRNGILEGADAQNHKKGRDIEVSPGRIILTSPDGTRYAVTVDNAGNLSTSAV